VSKKRKKTSKVNDLNFEYEKGVLRKSPFLNTFFGAGDYGGGRQFFKFFSKYFDS
jgi:hypothetical protein